MTLIVEQSGRAYALPVLREQKGPSRWYEGCFRGSQPAGARLTMGSLMSPK